MIKSTAADNQPVKGVAFLLVKIVVFSLQDVIIKWMSGDYPVHEIVFVRSIFALALILLMTRLNGGLGQLKTRHVAAHTTRAALLFATFLTYYLSLAALPLVEAITLSFTAPLFITVLSVAILGEKVSPTMWVAVIAGFCGVVFMFGPGGDIIDPAEE